MGREWEVAPDMEGGEKNEGALSAGDVSVPSLMSCLVLLELGSLYRFTKGFSAYLCTFSNNFNCVVCSIVKRVSLKVILSCIDHVEVIWTNLTTCFSRHWMECVAEIIKGRRRGCRQSGSADKLNLSLLSESKAR